MYDCRSVTERRHVKINLVWKSLLVGTHDVHVLFVESRLYDRQNALYIYMIQIMATARVINLKLFNVAQVASGMDL